MSLEDAVTMALALGRGKFVSQYAEGILVGDAALTTERRPGTTTMTMSLDWDDATLRLNAAPLPTSIVRALRKVRAQQPDKILLGRSPDNDIQLANESVSKFHAFFQKRAGDGAITLADCGSTNGTWADGRLLTPGDEPTLLVPGTRVRFGRVELTLVDSGSFWDLLRGGR